MIAYVTQPAQAAVQATLFDPPLRISAWSEVTSSNYINVLATDFNADGVADFRLAYGLSGIEAYLNWPTRFAMRSPQFTVGVSQPNIGIAIDGGPVRRFR
jgi:hypothetical protein